jgi:hypothetical protein
MTAVVGIASVTTARSGFWARRAGETPEFAAAPTSSRRDSSGLVIRAGTAGITAPTPAWFEARTADDRQFRIARVTWIGSGPLAKKEHRSAPATDLANMAAVGTKTDPVFLVMHDVSFSL